MTTMTRRLVARLPPIAREGFPGWVEEVERVDLLSAREREVFLLLAAGCSNRDISRRIRISERTAKAHVAQIMAKLQVESRLQAGLVAHTHLVMHESSIYASQGID